VRNSDDPMIAHIMARSSTLGRLLYRFGSTIFVRIVSATRDPTATDPPNSVKEAMIMACFMVNDRDDTDVANEFATSFAPTRCDWLVARSNLDGTLK
jgi:hypothetical protein